MTDHNNTYNNNDDNMNIDNKWMEAFMEKYGCFARQELSLLMRLQEHHACHRDEDFNVTFIQQIAATAAARIDASDSNSDVSSSNHHPSLDSSSSSWVLVPELETVSTAERMLPINFGKGLQSILSSAFVFSFCSAETEKLEVFLEGMANCLGKRGVDATRRAFYDCLVVSYGAGEIKNVTAGRLIDLSYRLAMASNVLVPFYHGEDCGLSVDYVHNNNKDDDHDHDHDHDNVDSKEVLVGPASLVRSLAKEELADQAPEDPIDVKMCRDVAISRTTFLRWADRVAPQIASTLSLFLQSLMFGPSFETKPFFPYISSHDNVTKSSFLTYDRLFMLACMSPIFSKKLEKLYNSIDGFSFRQLQYSLVGYTDPTVIIVKSTGGVFGFYSATRWKQSISFYGSSDCFLFQMEPTFGVFRPLPESEQVKDSNNFMYLCTSSRYDVKLNGLAIGGTVQKPRVHITENFEKCEAGSFDYSFEKGSLLASDWDRYFDVEDIEVWGIGDDESTKRAMEDRRETRFAADALLRKAQKVNKSLLLMDFNSRAVDNKYFAHKDFTSDHQDM